MSMFSRDPRLAIEGELACLREQLADAHARLDAAQEAANAADSVDSTEAALAKVSSMAGVVATLESKNATTECKLRNFERSKIEARRDELRAIVARDLSGFTDLTAELVKAELAARFALARTLEIQRSIIDRAHLAEAELLEILVQLSEPRSNATPIAPTVIRVAHVEVARQIQERFGHDREARYLAMSGLESAAMQLISEQRYNRCGAQERHDPRSPAHVALPGLSTPAPRGAA